MDSIFIIVIRTGQKRTIKIFSPAAKGLSTEGRNILEILLMLSN